jgi:hypothetical protein
MKKKIELRQGIKNRREANQSGRPREISVFPLTKLIMDVPGIRLSPEFARKFDESEVDVPEVENV